VLVRLLHSPVNRWSNERLHRIRADRAAERPFPGAHRSPPPNARSGSGLRASVKTTGVSKLRNQIEPQTDPGTPIQVGCGDIPDAPSGPGNVSSGIGRGE